MSSSVSVSVVGLPLTARRSCTLYGVLDQIYYAGLTGFTSNLGVKQKKIH